MIGHETLLAVAAATTLLLLSGRMPRLARITRTVDGDSLETKRMAGARRLRLVGIDAPEYPQEGGHEARAVLTSLVEGGRVLLLPCGRDVFGRTLCRIVTRRGCVACAMAWRGHAWGERPSTRALALLARIAGRGLWAKSGARHPRIWRLGRMRHPAIVSPRRPARRR